MRDGGAIGEPVGRRLAQRMSEPGDQDEDPAGAGGGPEGCSREQEHEEGDGDEREPDQAARVVAPLGEDLLGDRLVLALGRDDEDGGEVDEDPGAAEEGQDDEAEPEEGRVQVEVAAETAGRRRRPCGRPSCARGA